VICRTLLSQRNPAAPHPTPLVNRGWCGNDSASLAEPLPNLSAAGAAYILLVCANAIVKLPIKI
jgi:hypothetical protein